FLLLLTLLFILRFTSGPARRNCLQSSETLCASFSSRVETGSPCLWHRSRPVRPNVFPKFYSSNCVRDSQCLSRVIFTVIG
ncbi:hypothetical protein C8J57DRAFT_1466007, partial [Mycena rebaudengoi]